MALSFWVVAWILVTSYSSTKQRCRCRDCLCEYTNHNQAALDSGARVAHIHRPPKRPEGSASITASLRLQGLPATCIADRGMELLRSDTVMMVFVGLSVRVRTGSSRKSDEVRDRES